MGMEKHTHATISPVPRPPPRPPRPPRPPQPITSTNSNTEFKSTVYVCLFLVWEAVSHVMAERDDHDVGRRWSARAHLRGSGQWSLGRRGVTALCVEPRWELRRWPCHTWQPTTLSFLLSRALKLVKEGRADDARGKASAARSWSSIRWTGVLGA